jgi:hypothetical protein
VNGPEQNNAGNLFQTRSYVGYSLSSLIRHSIIWQPRLYDTFVWQPRLYWQVTSGHPPSPYRCPKPLPFKIFILPCVPTFLHMWSTPVGWLQHMPALHRLLLEISNTHNFWLVGPKFWNLCFCEAYSETHVYKKFQKIEIKRYFLKLVCLLYGHLGL